MIGIIAILVLSYIFLFFFISRILIPYLGFKKSGLPDKIPQEMQKEINRLKKRAKSKREFLLLAYGYLGKRFHGGRFRTFTHFGLMFKPIGELWSRKGFVHCTAHNHFLRIFLVKSGFFREEEIRLRHTFINFNIHQYVQVYLDGRWTDVDLSGISFNVPFGKHAWLFR